MAIGSTDRRNFLLGAGGIVAAGNLPGCVSLTRGGGADGFVEVDGTELARGGRPYRFTGTNAWYLAWLGADAAYGDRARLGRELDRLRANGITNLRIMASGEEGPVANSIKPGFVDADGNSNTALLEGLDFAMAEIGRRGMVAVLCLTNFWEWSGGMMNRLARSTGQWTDMNDPARPWPAFADAAAAFYSDAGALAGYYDYVAMLTGRTNSLTGLRYADDPAIMAWQLANEPRPGGSDEVIAQTLPHYYDWIDTTASIIRQNAPRQLVSLGHEGTQGANGIEEVVLRAHRNIDYITAHIWPLNWGWVDGKDLAGTWPAGKAKVEDYLATHIRLAEAAGKPLLVEEFGFPRDGELYSPDVPTGFRERYYRTIYDAAETHSAGNGGPVAGTNFWAWNGEARARHPDFRYRNGDNAYMGDPMHEPQGWYGIFDSDAAMLELIAAHSERFAKG